jgi:bacterioferritin (cytochrome b1)
VSRLQVILLSGKHKVNVGSLAPAIYLTLRDAIEKGLEFESKAVENYQNIAKKALESNDFVTYRLATTILADEGKGRAAY